jgi:RNA polymerase sigma-70 factor, ECF subfamily
MSNSHSSEESKRLERWLELARAGDNDALGEALESVRGVLLNLGYKHMNPCLEIRCSFSDLVQDSFVEAVQAFPRFRGIFSGEFVLWLSAILMGVCHRKEREYLEVAKRDMSLEIRLDAQSWGQEFVDELYAKTAPPEVELLTVEWWEALDRAIVRLNPKEQCVIRWRLDRKGAWKELAVLMGISVRWLRKLVRQGRNHLARLFLEELDGTKSDIPPTGAPVSAPQERVHMR